MALGKKQVDSTNRPTYEEREAIYAKSRAAAVEKALQGEKVRYKSNRNPEKFKTFLEYRLTIWDDLKEKTFYGKRMYEKTKCLIDNWN